MKKPYEKKQINFHNCSYSSWTASNYHMEFFGTRIKDLPILSANAWRSQWFGQAECGSDCEILSRWARKQLRILWTGGIFYEGTISPFGFVDTKNCRVWVRNVHMKLINAKLRNFCETWFTELENTGNGRYFFEIKNVIGESYEGFFGTMRFWTFESTQKTSIFNSLVIPVLLHHWASVFGANLPQLLHGESLPHLMASLLTGFPALWLPMMGLFERYRILWAFEHNFRAKDWYHTGIWC